MLEGGGRLSCVSEHTASAISSHEDTEEVSTLLQGVTALARICFPGQAHISSQAGGYRGDTAHLSCPSPLTGKDVPHLDFPAGSGG